LTLPPLSSSGRRLRCRPQQVRVFRLV
jgi:hypothetical protein